MRVLLTKMPPLLKDILSEALASESDMAVVSGAPRADLLTLVRQLAPDVVVTQAPNDEAASLARLVQSGAGSVDLVAINPDGRHALVFGHGETPVVLSDVSPTTIITAIRSI